MTSRVWSLFVVLALGLGVVTAAPVVAAPPTTVSVTLTYEGQPVDAGYNIRAEELNGPGSAYFDTSVAGTFSGTGASDDDSGVTPNTYIFKVYLEDDQTHLVYAFKKTLIDGSNDLGTFAIPKAPPGGGFLHGKVRSVKGKPLKRVDVEVYIPFPTVTVLENNTRVFDGFYDFVYDEVLSTITTGTKRLVIRPQARIGSKSVREPVTGFPVREFMAGKTTANLTYRPRPVMKVNGAYRTSFVHHDTYMPYPTTRSTIKVTRKAGKIAIAGYANVTTYGLKKAGGRVALQIDGKTVKKFTNLNSKDQFTASIKGISPGTHVMRVLYGHGPETRSAGYTFSLVVS